LPDSRNTDAHLLGLGRAVRQLRLRRGMSTDELATATGMTRRCIDALEYGHVDPTYELLLALADGLRIEPSALVILAEQLKTSDEP
jgi:transcriptional regulator with XRE-family HTH domain